MKSSLVSSISPAARQGGSRRAVVRAARAQADDRVAVPGKAALRSPTAMQSAITLALGNVLMSLPAHAEAGKIFDFNLTLPIMAAEFLALMVFLEKFWFTPVGKVLDNRDALIRSMLADTQDNKAELERLQKEAEDVVAKARQDAQKEIQAAQKAAEEENKAKLAEVKARIDRELAEALRELESERASAAENLESEVDKLANEILARVLPEGVKV